MKNEKILSLIVLLLVVIIGLQSYYIFGKKDTVALENVKSPVVFTDHKTVFDKNPFEQMQKMQKEMDKIFNNMTSNFSTMPEFEKFFDDMNISPALNIEDKKDSYEIHINIPGSDKNSIKINVKDGMLSVEAKTKKLSDKKSSNFLQKEIYEGSFVRRISVPKDADTDKLSSDYKNGILKITIPKKS
jgi:HSP20 family protein